VEAILLQDCQLGTTWVVFSFSIVVSLSFTFDVAGILSCEADKIRPFGVSLVGAKKGSINGQSNFIHFPSGNMDGYSFIDVLKNDAIAGSPSLNYFLVQENPTLSISMVQDFIDHVTFYNTNGLVCYFNYLDTKGVLHC
jgi:hypothetical protein